MIITIFYKYLNPWCCVGLHHLRGLSSGSISSISGTWHPDRRQDKTSIYHSTITDWGVWVVPDPTPAPHFIRNHDVPVLCSIVFLSRIFIPGFHRLRWIFLCVEFALLIWKLKISHRSVGRLIWHWTSIFMKVLAGVTSNLAPPSLYLVCSMFQCNRGSSVTIKSGNEKC